MSREQQDRQTWLLLDIFIVIVWIVWIAIMIGMVCAFLTLVA